MSFTEKLVDAVLGTLPKAALALIPEHWKKRALERLQDLDPFAVIADNHYLVRVLRVAWIDAAEHVLDAGRQAARSPEWSDHQRADIDRFHGLAIMQLRAIRDATFDRRTAPGTSAIDGHLPLVVRGAAERRRLPSGWPTATAKPGRSRPASPPLSAPWSPGATSARCRPAHLRRSGLRLLRRDAQGPEEAPAGGPGVPHGNAGPGPHARRTDGNQGRRDPDPAVRRRPPAAGAQQGIPEVAVRAIVGRLGGQGLGRTTITNVPIREPAHFLGRDDALATLRVAFGCKAGRVAITALHGLRGVGKTTLAAAYAERHRADYRAIWWIRAGTEAGLRADLVALGVRLAWVDVGLEEEPALATVMDRLRDAGGGLLLIYDNALDARRLAPHLPRGGAARILVTSNAPNWRGVAEPVEIAVWPPEVGADYLIARTGRPKERAAAEALSDALGGLPLAHEQAAAYCERLEIALAEYHRRFADRKVAMLEDARDAPADYHDGRTVAATFGLAIEAAAALHPAAGPLIGHLALLAPEPIPLFLLREGSTSLGAPLDALLDGDGLDEAIAALRALTLVGRETIVDERAPVVTTETLQVHRLVREVAAARLAAEARETMRGELVRVLHTVYPTGVYNDPETWPRARRLDGLVLALLDAEAELPKGTELAAGILLDRVASYRQAALGAYEQARSLFERALAIRERALPE
ncbi:hypothetical protein [Azospirillum argentinense]|uniref:hypothetical protein n=1 Tax=Azospirillum argentinense TaxID=2970906 RepID=UPI0032DE9F8E